MECTWDRIDRAYVERTFAALEPPAAVKTGYQLLPPVMLREARTAPQAVSDWRASVPGDSE